MCLLLQGYVMASSPSETTCTYGPANTQSCLRNILQTPTPYIHIFFTLHRQTDRQTDRHAYKDANMNVEFVNVVVAFSCVFGHRSVALSCTVMPPVMLLWLWLFVAVVLFVCDCGRGCCLWLTVVGLFVMVVNVLVVVLVLVAVCCCC